MVHETFECIINDNLNTVKNRIKPFNFINQLRFAVVLICLIQKLLVRERERNNCTTVIAFIMCRVYKDGLVRS